MAKTSARIATVAKAGRRSAPPTNGPHRTTPEDRARGRFMSNLGVKNSKPLYPNAAHWSEKS